MRLFPKIDSPCPYKGNLDDIIVGDMCRLCHKQVFDLTDLAEIEKKALLASCSASVCVRYKLSARSAIAAAIAASLIGLPAAASDDPPQTEVTVVLPVAPDAPFVALASSPLVFTNEQAEAITTPEPEEYEMIIVGGIEAPEMAQWVGVDGPPLPMEVDAPADEAAPKGQPK